MEIFEEKLQQNLYQFLCNMQEADEQLPQCPDVENKWESIARAYIPDGIREFSEYPTVSLGWMMYMGMAVARFWDEDWSLYTYKNDLYTFMRDKRGYDHMDEYIREEVLQLDAVRSTALERLVAECASRVNNLLIHQPIEPGTKEAFEAYVSCLHQLYLMGVAIQLKRMSYHMTEMNG